MTARCLCSLEPLSAEGYSSAAQRRFAGDDRPFPHRVAYKRSDLLTFLSTVVDRMSVSGVQEKVSLKLVDGALEPSGGPPERAGGLLLRLMEAVGGSLHGARSSGPKLAEAGHTIDVGGEFILKAVGAQLPRFVPDVPANEHVTMLIAERVFGIEVPPCGLVRLADDELAYLVKRFDSPRGQKIPQEDFSQLMERTGASHGTHFKYESSYEEVSETLRRFNQEPVQVERLFVRILFSYALSNGDAHLKNFSLYRPDPARPHVLTPAYDLLCTSLHIPTEARLALELFKDGFVTAAFEGYGFETHACFLELAARFEIPEPRARALLRPFVEPQPLLEALVDRSFLSTEAKADYLGRYRDRTSALRIGAD